MKKIVILSVMSLGISIAANAAFIDESSSNPFSQSKKFVEIGNAQGRVVHGFANNVSLNKAMRQIVPETYQVAVLSEDQKKVSWSGGKEWTQVLYTMSRLLEESRIIVDHDKREVSVKGSNSELNGTIANAEASGSDAGLSDVTLSSEVKTIIADATLSFEAELLTFDMDAGSQFHTALNTFLQANGWKLVWVENENFKVMASVHLTGTIDSIVEQLIDAVSRSTGSRYYATLYDGNRVVRIHR